MDVAAELDELLGTAVRADSMADVDALPLGTTSVRLRILDDEIAASLSRLGELRAILHDGTSRITDVGVRRLAALSSLEALDLEWSTAISDESLIALSHLPRLRWVDISFCAQLTESAIAAFLRSLPNCEVERDEAG